MNTHVWMHGELPKDLSDLSTEDLLVLTGVRTPEIAYSKRVDFGLRLPESALPGLEGITGEISGLVKPSTKWTNEHVLNVEMILANLLVARDARGFSYVSIPMTAGAYVARYTGTVFSYRRIKASVAALERLGYLTVSKGTYNRFKGSGYVTRLCGTAKLLNSFHFRDVQETTITRVEVERETIILKDERGRPTDYIDTETTRRWRGLLVEYNQFLAQSEIDLSVKDRSVDLSKTRVHRIFNNSSFNFGGRFYGPWWQSCKSEQRNHITINGHPTVEYDFSGQFVHLLYDIAGINYERLTGNSDPYTLNEMPSVLRKITKGAVLRVLNTKSRRSAGLSIRKMLAKEFPDHEASIDVERLLKAIEKKHAPVREYFYKQVGLELMRRDADMAEAIIANCLKVDITVLTVHDSFRVRTDRADELERILNSVSRQFCPNSPPPIRRV